MRAGFIEKERTAYFISDAPEPELPAEDWVKIQVKACGICGSEVHAYHGRHAFRKAPLISGHEFSGVVCQVGAQVTECAVGDRVTAVPQYSCGHCIHCLSGRDNLCPSKRVLGASYWQGPLGEYIVVPQHTVVKLGDNVSFEEGALIEPIANAMYAVRHTPVPITKDTTVCIIGAGPIGLADYICIKPYKPKTVAVVDIADANLDMAKKFGCRHVINNMKDDLAQAADELTGGLGFDMVFMAYGDSRTAAQAARITKPGGIIQLHAAMSDNDELPYLQFLLKELTLRAYQMYQHADFAEVAKQIADGTISAADMITHRFPIEQFHEAMEMADLRPEPTVKVMLLF